MSTTPSRPVPLGVATRTSPLTVGFELAGAALAGAVGAVALLSGEWQVLLQGAVGVIALLARTTGWWFRTYTLEEYELVLDEGIFRRRHRVVPYSRVQQVDVRQKLLHRVFGLATLEVETAAEAGATAVQLRLLDEATARDLRAFLLASQWRVRRTAGVDATGATDQEAPPPPTVTLVTLRPSELALAGASGASAVGFLVGGLAPAVWLGAVVTASGDASALGGAAVAALTLLVLGGTGVAGGIAQQVGRDYAYDLSVIGDDIHLRHGLFELREHTLPRRRVQQIRVLDNPIRRLLGMVTVVLHSAASPGGGEGATNILTIPALARDRVDGVLTALMGDTEWAMPTLVPRPPTARRRAVLRRALLLVLLAIGPAVMLWPGGILFFAAVGLAWPWGNAAHRLAGYQFAGSVAALASGVLVRRLDLIPRRRVQSGRTRSSYLQRRVGLASLFLDVAGTARAGPIRLSPGLHDVDAEVAEARARTVPVR